MCSSKFIRPNPPISAIATNSVETLVIMLATTSIGAVYSSTATDMGVNGEGQFMRIQLMLKERLKVSSTVTVKYDQNWYSQKQTSSMRGKDLI
jgi:hypothetical protein